MTAARPEDISACLGDIGPIAERGWTGAACGWAPCGPPSTGAAPQTVHAWQHDDAKQPEYCDLRQSKHHI